MCTSYKIMKAFRKIVISTIRIIKISIFITKNISLTTMGKLSLLKYASTRRQYGANGTQWVKGNLMLIQKVLFIIVLSAISSGIIAQNNDVEVTYTENSKGGYSYYAENRSNFDYIIKLTFKSSYTLKSSTTLPYIGEIKKGKNYLFDVQPASENMRANYAYTYSYNEGGLNIKPQKDFVYLLPVGEGKVTESRELALFRINDKDEPPLNWYALMFTTAMHDTIYAVRRGIVLKVKGDANLEYDHYQLTNKDNSVTIKHEDGSIAYYNVLDKVLIKEGKQVEAGEPIALAGGEKYESGPHIRLAIYYYIFDKEKSMTAEKLYVKREYITPFFYTKDNPSVILKNRVKYVGIQPPAIITKEMSKREIKKWEKTKGIKN